MLGSDNSPCGPLATGHTKWTMDNDGRGVGADWPMEMAEEVGVGVGREGTGV